MCKNMSIWIEFVYQLGILIKNDTTQYLNAFGMVGCWSLLILIFSFVQSMCTSFMPYLVVLSIVQVICTVVMMVCTLLIALMPVLKWAHSLISLHREMKTMLESFATGNAESDNINLNNPPPVPPCD